MVREVEVKEQDPVRSKDQMQGEWPREIRAVNDNKVKKETEK